MFSPFHSAGGHGLICIVVIATASRSEIKWLQMWWPAQTNETKAKFRAIVRSGQLEFAGAGWSQNDVMRLPGGLLADPCCGDYRGGATHTRITYARTVTYTYK